MKKELSSFFTSTQWISIPLVPHIQSFVWLALLSTAVLTQAAESEPNSDPIPTGAGDLVIQPVNHATFLLSYGGKTIYVDPVGGAGRFAAFAKPNIILITDIHGDHLNADTLEAITTDSTQILAPSAVVERMPQSLRKTATVISNGESKSISGIQMEAVPMYNLTADRLKFHAKGRGNGYLMTLGGKRVYISGDTEDSPEMRKLKNIDVAFICMNLPYTMTVDQAASAVREFKPKIVYPYHSRGSDLAQFHKLVGTDLGIEVRIRDWY